MPSISRRRIKNRGLKRSRKIRHNSRGGGFLNSLKSKTWIFSRMKERGKNSYH